MSYETSYDTGLKPFIHDKDRGKWSSSTDFFFACIGHAFKVDAVFVLPALIFSELGIYTLIPHFIVLAVCVVPIVFMQSFLGQFSSTGFISVFRIAPLFKGIGYVSLAINLTTLTYYSVFGAIPLFYFFHSLRPTIPWSCEGAEEWMELNENMTSVCAKNHTYAVYTQMEVPSVVFFKHHLNIMDLYDDRTYEGTFSWSLLICTFIVWAMAAVVLMKPVEFIGRFMRYSCLVIIGIMSLCLLRFVFLPNAVIGLIDFFHVNASRGTFLLIPVMALSALGPGWGSILTMASYNNFKTNIYKYSWLLCLAQVGIMLGLAFMSMFITNFMQRHNPDHQVFYYVHKQWMEFLIIPTALTFLELPHFWSLLFFGMLTLGCLNLLIVQLFSVLTSMFDEYLILRGLKREVTLAAVGVLSVTSIYFCSNHGIVFFELLAKFSIMTQMILNLLLLLMVLWIYGRERFQRDVHFMTGRTYSTWMVNIARFVAPLFLLFGWLIGLLIFADPLFPSHAWVMISIILVTALIPWCLVPGYCVYKVMQTTGMLGMRLKRSVRPTDWYPVEPLDRQRYEVTFSNTDISQQLTTEADAV